MTRYCFSYTHQGARYHLDVEAASVSDAKLKVQNMSAASFDGELIAIIPAKFGWFARLFVRARNWL